MVTEKLNPKLDLVLELTLDLTPAQVWKGWTTPSLLTDWFCPKPWTISQCELDLRPGGIFRTVMRSPEGQEFPNLGCVLEAIPEKKFTWTNILHPGFRPAPAPVSGADMFLTATILMEPAGKQTRYKAIAMHRTEADKKQHEEMGFEMGWTACANQLVELIKK